MPTKTAVKNRVSPTLHPGTITSIPGYEQAKGYVQHATTALDAAYQAVEHVMEARQKLQLDESRTQKARVLMAAQMGNQYLDKLQKSFEASWDKLSAGIEHTDKALSQPIEEYAGIGNVATEIRAHLKNMTSGERTQFLFDALERGDERTMKSVLGAPSYLSGMSDIDQVRVTRDYHSKNNPEMAHRLEVMRQVREKLEKAKPIIFTEMEKAIGATRFEIEKLQATSNEAEAALVLKEFAPSEN